MNSNSTRDNSSTRDYRSSINSIISRSTRDYRSTRIIEVVIVDNSSSTRDYRSSNNSINNSSTRDKNSSNSNISS